MRTIAAAALAAIVLVAVHLAAGGGAYEVADPPDPCADRQIVERDGTLETVERIGLRAVGVAACQLGVSREGLLLSLARDRRLPEGVDAEEAADAFRMGAGEAIADEQQAGRLGLAEALLLRQAVEVLPVDQLLGRFFGGLGG